MRGFMTARGLPDNPRSSRHILKDFVNGKLLYCTPPTGIDGTEFQELNPRRKQEKIVAAPTPFQIRITKVSDLINVSSFKEINKNYVVFSYSQVASVDSKAIDQAFFNQSTATAHSKGRAATPGETNTKGVVSNSSMFG